MVPFYYPNVMPDYSNEIGMQRWKLGREYKFLLNKEKELLPVIKNDKRPFWKRLFSSLPEKQELENCKRKQKEIILVVKNLGEKLLMHARALRKMYNQ